MDAGIVRYFQKITLVDLGDNFDYYEYPNKLAQLLLLSYNDLNFTAK